MRRTVGIALVAACTLAWIAFAQPAAAEAGQRTRVAVGVGVGYGHYPFYYRPVFYDPFAWGYAGWYAYPWRPYGPYGYYPVWGYDPAASVRIETEPREAQVFVDGYFMGIVDDFNGWSQRLRLPPGEYEIQVYHEGYQTLTERMLLRPGVTYRIRRDLERLPDGAPAEPRPEPSPAAAQAPAPGPRPGPPPGRYPSPRADRPGRGETPAAFGTIAIRVRPADAEVYIDGERWDRTSGDGRLTVDLAVGTHTVEVRREGYTTYTAQVDVRSGRVTQVNVSLPER